MAVHFGPSYPTGVARLCLRRILVSLMAGSPSPPPGKDGVDTQSILRRGAPFSHAGIHGYHWTRPCF